MPEFSTQPAYEISRRLDLRGEQSYAWFVVLKPAANVADALMNLCEELSVVAGTEPRVLDVTGLLPDDITEAARTSGSGILLLEGLDERSEDFWRALDINRSGLERAGGIIFWLSIAGLADFCSYAPNLRSFVGGSIFQLGPDGGVMTESERTSRLNELRQHYGCGDDELLRMATSRELPPNPQFVEWLILLGRGDLI